MIAKLAHGGRTHIGFIGSHGGLQLSPGGNETKGAEGEVMAPSEPRRCHRTSIESPVVFGCESTPEGKVFNPLKLLLVQFTVPVVNINVNCGLNLDKKVAAAVTADVGIECFASGQSFDEVHAMMLNNEEDAKALKRMLNDEEGAREWLAEEMRKAEEHMRKFVGGMDQASDEAQFVNAHLFQEHSKIHMMISFDAKVGADGQIHFGMKDKGWRSVGATGAVSMAVSLGAGAIVSVKEKYLGPGKKPEIEAVAITFKILNLLFSYTVW